MTKKMIVVPWEQVHNLQKFFVDCKGHELSKLRSRVKWVTGLGTEEAGSVAETIQKLLEVSEPEE